MRPTTRRATPFAAGPRATASMFAAPGTLYVYRSYGIHWCVNVACEPEGDGRRRAAACARAHAGLAEMRERRGRLADRDPLLRARASSRRRSGSPGADDGLSIVEPPFALEPPAGPVEFVATPRIGITKAVELPWRYVLKETRWSSRGRRSASPSAPRRRRPRVPASARAPIPPGPFVLDRRACLDRCSRDRAAVTLEPTRFGSSP